MSRKKYSLIGEIADFDYHGFWGDWCSPKSLKAWLDKLEPGEEAEIEINSPGGLVVQGIEMANAIKNSKAVIVAHVTGIAASMASVIACACSRIEMEEASFMMIHDPWGYIEGSADEMRKQAGVLDQMKAVIMSFYRGKFKGKTDEEIAALMTDETWYTGAECKENGLDCTVIASDVKAAASIVGHKFKKIPDGAAKFLTSKEITDEGRAEIEAAKAAAKAETAAEGSTGNTNTDISEHSEQAADAEGSTVKKTVLLQDYLANPEKVFSPEEYKAIIKELDAEGYAARYKGASKKINELQARIADLEKREADRAAETVDYGAVVAERDTLKAQNDALAETGNQAVKALKDFADQVKASGYENLAALIGAVSGLKADLEKRDQELAQARQQLDHMAETRDLLTGGVLSPGNGNAKYSSFAEAVDAIGYVEACRRYPDLKAAYRRKGK